MRFAAGGLAVVAIAFVADLYVAARGDLSPIDLADLEAARRAIDAKRKPADVLVHSPLFTMTELNGLGAVASKPDLPAEAVRERRRVLLLDRVEAPMRGFGAPSEVVAFGPSLRLLTFEPSADGPLVVYDLVSSIEEAEMEIERPPGTVKSRCTAPRAEGGRSCPGEAEWLYLQAKPITIDGKNETCVWAHPTTGGVIVIRLPAQSVAEGRRLEVHVEAALSDDAANGTPDGAPVRTSIEQRGQVKGRLVVPNQPGWQKTTLPIDPDLPVDLKITTERDGRRHHCVTAEIREVPR